MRVTTEVLNDARPPMHGLRAVLLGPLLLAGVTEGERDVEEDPTDIASLVGPVPGAAGLVSLAPAVLGGGRGGGGEGSAAEAGGVYLRHQGGAVAWGQGGAGGGGSAMDATFRLAPPLAACADAAPDAGGAVRSACAAGAAGRARLVSFESMSLPGRFLTAAGAPYELTLQPGAAALRTAQTFALHSVGGDEEEDEAVVWLEPLSSPGACIGAVSGPSADGASGGGEGGCQAFRLAPPAAPAYPRGARLLRGRRRQYLLVPIGQVQDERYTAYFNFVVPRAEAAAPGEEEDAVEREQAVSSQA